MCKSYTTIIISTGHKYDNGTVVKEATCTEKGQKAYKCSKCSFVKLEDIAATGHKYGEAVVLEEATWYNTWQTGSEVRSLRR